MPGSSRMFSPTVGITLLVCYAAIVFATALWVERKAAAGKDIGNNAVIYTFSFAVWLTAWSFYGQVGRAATSGMLYLTSHLGATLSIVLWWVVLRKMVRIRHTYRITSIADLISLRYDKSPVIAAFATVIAIVGIVPYLALQLKAVISTFGIIIQSPDSSDVPWATEHFGLVIVAFMILFTILFGVRRLVPTERHQGMVVSMAAESGMKLLAFLAVGIFATYFLNDGFVDIFRQFAASPLSTSVTSLQTGGAIFPWVANLLMAMSAVIFVPALFHIMVVENFHENHIRTSMWLFPLFMFLMNLFVLPIAMAGLLMGHTAQQADSFVLTLPFSSGHSWLTLFAFFGGLSSAMGMLVVNAVTLSTMFTNHILLPLIEAARPLSFLKRYLLQCRWGAVAVFILASYWFEQTVGRSAMLSSIGVIAFAAVLQFAPTIIGGLFWKKGNKAGALLGMSAGFAVWLYSLILPAFIKGGVIASASLEHGPMGIDWLHPEHLFGISGLDPATHAVFWSMFFNIGLYVLGSLFFEQTQEEKNIARKFVHALAAETAPARLTSGESIIDASLKKRKIEELFCQYFPEAHAAELTERCICSLKLDKKKTICIVELAELHTEVEKNIASSIGAASAYAALRKAAIFDQSEEEELKQAYAEIMTELRLPPSELVSKIDYYREKERLQIAQAKALEETLRERDREITERKRAEDALRNSERQLSDLINLLPDITFAVNREGAITLWNRTAEEFTGMKAKDMLGKKNYEYALPFYGKRRPVLIDVVLNPELCAENAYSYFKREGGMVVGETYTQSDSRGAVYWLAVAAPLYDSEGNIVGAIESIRDITDRKLAEEALAQEKERLAVTLQSIGDGVITTDMNGNVLLINNMAEQMTGWEQPTACGRPLAEVFRILNPKTRELCESPFHAIIRTGEVIGPAGHSVLVSRDNSEKIVANKVAPIRDKENRIIGSVLVFRDVTETVRIEEELLKAQKIESLGILAGGIAHDFNNILTSIMGNISMAKLADPMGDRLARSLEEAEKASLRAKDLTRQLLTFSRGGAPIKKIASVADIIQESANFALTGADARCEFSLPHDLWPAELDEGQISQVIHNITINADQAMPDGGIIRIHVENIRITEHCKLPLQPGKYILVSISDTGVGLPGEYLDKIFDPYFTTKQTGSGLGLTSSYSIIRKHGGNITVESEVGVGTTFHIYLPASEKELIKKKHRAGPLHKGNGRVLVMDDEEPVRQVVAEMLDYLGYEAEYAWDGSKGIAAYQKAMAESRPFDVVIMDLTVPGGMGGLEMFRQLRTIDPDINAIVSSGYSMDPIMADYRSHGFSCVVTKPYKIQELSSALQMAIQRRVR